MQKLSIYKRDAPAGIVAVEEPSPLELSIRNLRKLTENEFAKSSEFIQSQVDAVIEFEKKVLNFVNGK